MGFSLPLHPSNLPQTPRPTQWTPQQYPQSTDWIKALYSLMSGTAQIIYDNKAVKDAGGGYGVYLGSGQPGGGGDQIALERQRNRLGMLRGAAAELGPVPEEQVVWHELGHRLAQQSFPTKDQESPVAADVWQLMLASDERRKKSKRGLLSANDIGETFPRAVGEAITALAGGPGYNPPQHTYSHRADEQDLAAMMHFLKQQPAFRDLVARQMQQLPDMTRVVR